MTDSSSIWAVVATGALLSTKVKSIAVYLGVSAPIIAFFEVLGVDINILIVWFVFMLIDLLMASWIYLWDKTYSSSSAQRWLAKKGVYVLIMGCMIFLWTIQKDVQFITSTFLMAFVVTEFISILRHGYTVVYKEKLPESEVVRNLFRKIIDLMDAIVQKAIKISSSINKI